MLDAHPSWVKASFTTTTGAAVRINDGCLGTAADWKVSLTGCERGASDNAVFKVYRYRTDGSGNPDTGSLCQTITSNSTIGGSYVLQDGWSVWLDISSCLGSNRIDSTTGLYGVYISADVSNPDATGVVNSFKMQSRSGSGQSFIGYADSTRTSVPVAIQNVSRAAGDDPDAGPSTGIQNDIVVRMRQSCTDGAPTPLRLKWQDADAGASGDPVDADVWWTLSVTDEWGNVKYSTSSVALSGAGSPNDASNVSYLGGQGVQKSYTYNGIMISPGDQIVWRWNNLRQSNGLQVFPFYDNNFYGAPQKCGNVHGSIVNAACTQLSGYAYDFDRLASSVRVYVYLDNPRGTTGTPSTSVLANDANPTNPRGGSHGFTINPETAFPTTRIRDFQQHKFYVYGQTIDSKGNPHGDYYPLNNGDPTALVGPCTPPISCGDLGSTPANLDSYMRFSLTPKVSVGTTGGFVPPPGQMRLTIKSSTGSGWSYGPASKTAQTSPGLVQATYANLGPTGSTGVYNVTWEYIVNGSVAVTCQADMSVVNLPYLTVYGGDTQIGAAPTSTPGTCYTGDKEAGAYSWNNHSSGYSGAGAQYAVMALGQIEDYASNLGGNGRSAAPHRLSFANTVGGTVDDRNGLFGGKFGTVSTSCDFTSDIKVAQVSGGSASGSLPNSLADGDQVTIYASGDVHIGHDVVYANNTWTSLAQMPSLRLIVEGNIYIDRSVTQLDGLYVALPTSSGNGGVIYTCTDGDSPVDPKNPQFYDKCNSQLVINGAFGAKQVQFLRTSGSVGLATTDTYTNSGAAEVFHYSPEVWLPRGGGNASLRYDSITGLPPVL
jgi:hypothetical protein